MRDVTVLGLGNVLLGDEGIGIVAVHRLQARFGAPPAVRFVDGGTLGLGLLDLVCGADVLLLVDAVAAAAPPGTLVRVEGDDVETAVATRLSPHQIGVGDLLTAARFLHAYPREVVLYGVVPESLELDRALSPPVAQALPGLLEAVTDELARLGHPLRPREADDASARRSPVDVARALGL
jgi:hydrogenase maturation protease